MDFGDSDYQIIEYCDTILTYGIGYVKNANTISNNNIVWNSSYPLIRRKLAVTQQETIQNAISKLKTCSIFWLSVNWSIVFLHVINRNPS